MSSALAAGVERLIASQAASWPLLARGLEGLRESRTRAVRVASSEVLVRHIPHRIRSTTAAVDAASVAKRPCFLCAANLPPEEKGFPLDTDFVAYCNPFPILEKHLTIVHREHRPQEAAPFLGAFLALAQSLPGLFLVYNGPRCGASAPDHLHFQACSRELFPVGRDAAQATGRSIPDAGRRVAVLRDVDARRLAARAGRFLAILSDVTGVGPEPLVNLAAFFEADRLHLLVFPRAKHRPRAFETGELTVSPAAIDMSGVLVVPLPGDFERIGEEEVTAVLDEVSLAPEPFAEALRRLEVAP